jgi:hypothetical protein
MYALNNLKGNGKEDGGDHIYKPLETSDQTSPSDLLTTKVKDSKKLKPPLWNTLEFYIHYVILFIFVVSIFYTATHISKGTYM